MFEYSAACAGDKTTCRIITLFHMIVSHKHTHTHKKTPTFDPHTSSSKPLKSSAHQSLPWTCLSMAITGQHGPIGGSEDTNTTDECACVLRRKYRPEVCRRRGDAEISVDIHSPSVRCSVLYILWLSSSRQLNSVKKKSGSSARLSAGIYKALTGMTCEGLDKFF